MLMAVAFSWRVYQDYRRDRETNALVAEKERTIQRLAADNRELRIALLKNLGKWSDEDIQRYILLNVPPDGPAARKLLEQSPSLPQAPSKTRRK